MIRVPQGAEAAAGQFHQNTALREKLVSLRVLKGSAIIVLAVFIWPGPKQLFTNGFEGFGAIGFF